MWRFRFYGFFKNLRFFEPYLLILLINLGLSLFKIGILIFIREFIIYLTEIPSGVLADSYGRKRILMSCFIFYIISFIFYFIGIDINYLDLNYLFLIIASIFYGFGESFRSGCHKSMEIQWMDRNDLMDYKSYIYGSTRSYSLYGSSLSSLLAIVLILNIPAAKWIFIITIIPYIIDFVLISTYPKYMNEHKLIEVKYLTQMKNGFKDIWSYFKNPQMRKGLFSSSFYDAIYKSLKDFIQPIMKLFIAIMIIKWANSSSSTDEEKLISIILGVIYFIFYLLSSISSKNAYLFNLLFDSQKKAMDILFYVFAGVLFLVSLFIWLENPIMTIALYLLIYILENMRRPICVDYFGEIMPKDERTTILSVESQLKSIFVLIFAPIFGLIADFNMGLLFLILGILMVLINLIIKGEK